MKDIAVGFIGLGRMGKGMVGNLRKGGVAVRVYDANPAVLKSFTADGVASAASAAELAAQVDLLFMCLPFEPQVREALFGADGVASGARAQLQVVDTTTLNHSDALDIGAKAAEAGIRYADCPISGMPMRAADGTLTIMFGGSDADFASAKPFLDLMGTKVLHCGALGNGQMMKAINNIIYNINIVGICEVLPLAVKAGLDVEQVAEVVTSGTSRSFASDYFVPRILNGDFGNDFTMGEAHKDIVNVQQIATRLKATIPLISAMTASYQMAMALGHADEPKSAIIKVYEKTLNQKVRHAGVEDDTQD